MVNNSNKEIDQKPDVLNFNEQELNVLKYWQDNNIFEKSLENTKNNEPFVFYDGPPFATGTPHYGHILGSAVKDTIGRYQTMKGRFVRRVWGWDCHGLPIENIVEQKLGVSGKKPIEEMGIDKFNLACRENVLTYVAEWGKMVERMGRWVDFENSYKTMDTSYMESVWWGLKTIWDKKLIYQDNKVLMYCSRCETPMSNFEVAMDNSYKDVIEDSVFVKFQVTAGQRIVDFITTEKTFVLAWTTTPWTLPGNTALNIGPDITYVIVEQNQEQYILAKDRLEILEGAYEIRLECEARSLEGLSYQPLYSSVIANPNNTAFKIYIEDFVTTTDGTGVVHNAAMYGEEDYQAAINRNLPREQMLNHQGKFLDNAPEMLRQVFFKKADKLVLHDLADRHLVYRLLSFTHSYPHCWRCATPLYYSALPSWFISISAVKSRLLELNQNISWFPAHLKNGRFAQGIENAPDWNISRNRYWATPLPFWKCEDGACGELVCVGSVAELKEKSLNFAEVYANYDSANYLQLDLHRPFIDRVKLKCEKCGTAMTRIEEVVDCWVESASMSFAELHYPFENTDLFAKRFPADFVAEYIPQTRAWFYVMHVLGTILFDKEPFKNVVTTGTILAEDGTKMSKSKNNFPDPGSVIEKFGVDAVRYYLLGSPVVIGEDLSFSETSVAEVNRKLSLIYWNTWKFFRMYSQEIISEHIPQAVHSLDVWILEQLAETHSEVTSSMDNFNTTKSCRALQNFITELSTWYVRRSRDRVKLGNADSQNALAVLGFVLVETSKMLAPLMPFISEMVYRDLTGQESVHLAKWSNVRSFDGQVLNEMASVRGLVEQGLALRKEQNVKVRQPLGELIYSIGETGAVLASGLEQILAEELNVKKVQSGEILSRNGWVGKTGYGVAVNLNFFISKDLKDEGLARDLERQIQDLRKKSGLKVGQLVDLYYNCTDTGLVDILFNQVDRNKTFVNQIKSSLEVEVDFESQGVINGQALWLGLVII